MLEEPQPQKKFCCNIFTFFSFECMKFLVCVAISFISMGFGMYLLISDKFKTVAISAFATSLITNVITFWVDSPKIKRPPD